MITDKLTDLRKKAGYTQQDMADILGVERSTYACYETGKAKVPVDKIQKLSVVYKVPLDYFMEYSGSFLNDSAKYAADDADDAETLTREERIMLAQIRLLYSYGKEKEVREALNQLSKDL